MSHPFRQPKAQRLLERVALFFRAAEIYLRTSRHIVFVCGGPVTKKKFARKKFLDYAKSNLSNFTFFLAEDASYDLLAHGKPQFLNLSEFERLIGEIADCIILFPETPGSIAELGLFSAHEDTREKLLLANSIIHRADESFINRGPVATTDAASIFRPTLFYTNLSSKDVTFSDIGKLLKNRLCNSLQRKHFDHDTLRTMKLRDRLLLVYEMIKLFHPIDHEGLNRVITSTFSRPEAEELRFLVSILIAAKYIRRQGHGPYFFAPSQQAPNFFDYETQDYSGLRIDIIDFYRSHYRDAYTLMQEKTR